MRICVMMAAVGLVAGSGGLQAEGSRGLGAHEHGHSTLNIAIEGERVLMELDAPGMDIVGFEHAATSDADQAAIARAEETLADPMKLFVMPAAARCTVETADVALAGDRRDDHADEAEHAEDESEGHTEFHAEYTLGCANPEALETIRFAFFEKFAGAEEVEVNVISERGQTSYEVERDQPSIDLGAVM
ncbi:MAG: DUF2796 domain-containing protein [Geminicoccaceae bacterium]|nr:DUF2796 domain-containing protein [Geminicoccaceae bacterium]